MFLMRGRGYDKRPWKYQVDSDDATEHLAEIREWKKEQFYDKKRELIEWELEEIEQTIQRAFKLRQLVTLTLWQNHNLGNKTGFVTGMDPYKKELLLDTDISGKRIAFNDRRKVGGH
ncbi:YolD-like family protein [Lysinibacillus sp. JNUCC 51]|uniref:YolD-like family protein n=1 Tax=Lysinibacillus sp. JNUCC-51 TaxID=2792479 RepID=UPI001938EF65|nr:YolD-like family protein [Lysinibacillus sp. JNUCC-51]